MPPTHYSAIVIGSGQGGTPLASAFANAGRKTALIEATHIGGTCINEGCTPTKTMVASARVAYLASRGSDYGVVLSSGKAEGDVKVDMKKVRARKREIVKSFSGGSEKRLKALEEKGSLDVLMGTARFVEGGGSHQITVKMNKTGEERQISGDDIFINVGCRPATFELPGLSDSGINVLDSTTIMELDHVPEHLVVIGGRMFKRFGSKVTIIHRGSQLLAREDPDIADEVRKILEEDGIEIHLNSQAQSMSKPMDGKFELQVRVKDSSTPISITATHLLAAAGRTPNTDTLSVSVAGLTTNSRGFIHVDNQLRTNIPGISALGDVNGGAQFTHISYDDFRILKSNHLTPSSEGRSKPEARTTANRLVPYTVFMDPQLGRIGLTETEARKQGKNIKVAKMPMAYVARALEMDESRGVMKAVVDADTGEILGAAILGIEGGEVMTMLQIAMMGKVRWEDLQSGVFAHPGLGEALNNLWAYLE